MQIPDPLSIIENFDAAWNNRDVEGVLDFFTDDAVVTFDPPLPPPGRDSYAGKHQIRELVEMLLSDAFRVVSDRHQVDGNRVVWHSMIVAGAFRELGIDELESTMSATIVNDRIGDFAVVFSLESARKLETAASRRELPR